MGNAAREIPDTRVDWSPERQARVLASLHGRRRRRSQRRVVALAALTCVLGAVLVVGVRSSSWSKAPTTTAAAAATLESRAVVLSDGSVAERLDARTRLRIVEDASSLSVVELEAGAARFDVKPNRSRTFRVQAGPVVVEVVGTAFTVSRGNGAVTTSVERGHVRVERGLERVDLYAGDEVTLPEVATPRAAATASTASLEERAFDRVELHERGRRPLPETATSRPATAPASPSQGGARSAPAPADPPPNPHSKNWAALARAGEFDQAYDAMSTSPGPLSDDPGELLLAADVARLSRHSFEAIAPLRRIVDKHAGDARAPLAAFTLGRVLLDEVGRPREAAEMFARARGLAPDGPLAEDALAREVEAWWRVGNTEQTHARAAEYVQRYPSGTKLKSVRRFGGLD